MRFSTGTQLAYGADAEGAALMISGDPALRIVAPPPIWDLSGEKLDGTRIWRLPKGKTLSRVQRPVKPAAFNVLTAHLELIDTVGTHPALKNGLEAEAKRLYPKMSSEAASDFAQLTAFLGEKFGITLSHWEAMAISPFTDDIGPELLVLVNGQIVPLPEMPPVYTAPSIWGITQWTAANAMFGPYADDNVPDHQQISFTGVGNIPDAQSPLVEGLIYYHGARFITIYEAWVANPEMPLLRKFIRLILSGQRPWQTNILPLA